jgi:hypothetical protein
MSTNHLSKKHLADLARFMREIIMFPQFSGAYHRLIDSIATYQSTGVAENHILHGHAGCGKTTLCQLLESEFPRSVETHRDVVPLLYTSVPALATIGSVAEACLRKLGDPVPTQGTSSAKTDRLITLIEGCRVAMVILDEVQHVHDRGQSPTIYKVADWIKTLSDNAGRPMVLAGLPRSKALIDTNEQLRRRFGSELVLDRMTLDCDECVLEFASLARSLLDALPLRSSLDVSKFNELERLYYATDGRIGYVVSLFYRALILAFEAGEQLIGHATLERAFCEVIWSGGIGPLNPFSENFVFRKLDKLGEPFGPTGASTKRLKIRRNTGRDGQ